MSSLIRIEDLFGVRGHVTAIKLNREAFIIIATGGVHASLRTSTVEYLWEEQRDSPCKHSIYL